MKASLFLNSGLWAINCALWFYLGGHVWVASGCALTAIVSGIVGARADTYRYR